MSDAFALVSFDELAPQEQEQFAPLCGDRDFYGLLKPAEEGLPAKSVSRDVALLLLTLRRPRRIPALITSIFDGEETLLRTLLADGVLEVEDDGEFVRGEAALRIVRGDTRDPRGSTRASRLSTAAIEYAVSCEQLDASALAERIYAYGRLPCTPVLRKRLASETSVLAFLTSDPGIDDVLAGRWTRGGQHARWFTWTSRGCEAPLDFKLYVSAAPDAMPRLFGMAVRAFDRARCSHFKVGRSAEDLCRPDKMVGYFESLAHLRGCADHIERELASAGVSDVAAHGVPFTASVDVHGFLSWGMDPPKLPGIPSHLQDQSWRQWIARRAGAAIVSARQHGTVDVVDFVLERLELDGIDTRTWVPSLAIWSERAAGAGFE